jgi:hypothetical protein
MNHQKLARMIGVALIVLILSGCNGGCRPSTTCPSTPQAFDLIEELAVDLSTWYFLEFDTDGAIATAKELGVCLSKNDLTNDKEKETIERIASEISGMCGDRAQALFKTRYHSLTAQLWLGYASASLDRDDYPEANGAIVIAGANMNDAVSAAKQASIEPEIISEGEAIVEYLIDPERGIANTGSLTKQQNGDALLRVIQWGDRAIKALRNSTP